MSSHEGLVADRRGSGGPRKEPRAVGARLLASAVVFFFMAFVFAFFYLRALDTNHDFHPARANADRLGRGDPGVRPGLDGHL